MRRMIALAPRLDADGFGARCLCLVGLGVWAMLGAACGGKGPVSADAERGVRDTTITTEPCARDVQADVNRDGKPDLFEGMRGGQVWCRAADLDFDGVIDQTTFFDEQGRVRRRESDLDGDGKPNVIELYEHGVLSLRMMDTHQRGKIDVWDLFDKSGVRTARERDIDGNGRIDEYWSFAGEQTTIRFDVDGDGLPDAEGELRYGEPPAAPPEGVPPASEPARPSEPAPDEPAGASEGGVQ